MCKLTQQEILLNPPTKIKFLDHHSIQCQKFLCNNTKFHYSYGVFHISKPIHQHFDIKKKKAESNHLSTPSSEFLQPSLSLHLHTTLQIASHSLHSTRTRSYRAGRKPRTSDPELDPQTRREKAHSRHHGNARPRPRRRWRGAEDRCGRRRYHRPAEIRARQI